MLGSQWANLTVLIMSSNSDLMAATDGASRRVIIQCTVQSIAFRPFVRPFVRRVASISAEGAAIADRRHDLRCEKLKKY